MQLLNSLKQMLLNTPDTAIDETAHSLTPVKAYTILANERRCQIIEHLVHVDDETTARKLSEVMAESEECGRQSLYIVLTQNHLPRLSDVDCIEYDESRKTVAAGPTLALLHHIHSQTQQTLRAST